MQETFFHKTKLAISPGVYEPREDSFLLANTVELKQGSTVLDLGCGIGMQGVNALQKGAAKTLFVDINLAALDCAMYNAKTLGFPGKVEARQSNLFENVSEKFDLIIFNPPYVPSDKVAFKEVDGGKKGREILDLFLDEMPNHLKKGGSCFFLQSSLNGEKETEKVLEKKGLVFSIVARQKLFFEELLVFSCQAKKP